MPIKQRGKRGIYWVEFTAPSGKRVRCSARTDDPVAAQEYHDKLKAESWRRDVLGQKPAPFFLEVAVSFLKAKEDRASKKDMKRHITFWRQHFGTQRIDAITRSSAAAILEANIEGPATKNRYIGTLRSMLRMAEAEFEDTGYRAPRLKTYEEPLGPEVLLREEDFGRLYAVLPDDLKAAGIFAVAVGIRQGNLMGLRWDWIDLQKGVVSIPRRNSKNRKPYVKPLNRRAIEVLRGQYGKHLELVFPCFWVNRWGEARTKPIFPYWYFYKALKTIQHEEWYQRILRNAGLKRLRWHDLRHTFASVIAQQNASARVLQESGNWESEKTPVRYSHLGMEHLKPYFDGVADWLDTALPQAEVA